MEKIPFVDLKGQYLSIKEEIDGAINNVLQDSSFIGGKHVKNFEDTFSKLYGVKNCISCANGTDAIYIILKMLGVGPGDEVITSACSWISTSETISQTGAKPVFVDIEPSYFTIDPQKIEGKITTKTKAIIPVHLYGQMAQMDVIKELATKHNLYLIEDCAQSHFSELDGKRAGSFGTGSTFSFYPGKNLGAYGDAGCILTDDGELAKLCKMFANHGALVKHQHQMEGINSRMDSLQAAILNVKLPYILEWTEKRKQVARWYDSYLADIKDIVIPAVRENSSHSYHLYVIRSNKRDQLQAYLGEQGIETAIHYPTPLPFLKAYEYLGHSREEFPVAAEYQEQILSLPIYPELSEEKVKFISEAVKKFYS